MTSVHYSLVGQEEECYRSNLKREYLKIFIDGNINLL